MWTPHCFDGWKHMTSNNVKQQRLGFFKTESFGPQIYEGLDPDRSKGDVVVSRHWNSDAFKNTDLDFQLRQREMKNLVFAGLTANTCLEATARKAFELVYNVTLLRDATAGYSKGHTEAVVNLVWPLFAQRVITVKEWIESLREEGN